MIHRMPDIGVRAASHWIFNCYLVEDGGAGAPFVVDAGLPMTARAAHRELTETMARDGGELAVITATHGHSDHVAGAPLLRRATGADIRFHDSIRDYVAGRPPTPMPPLAVLKIAPVFTEQPFEARALVELARTSSVGLALRGRFAFSPPIAGYFADGDPVPGCPDWQAIHAPGHTDCSVVFWNARTRTLLSGDAVLTVGGRAWFNPEQCDPAASEATERKLRALPVEHLLPGHGLPIHGPDIMRDAWSFRDPVLRGPLMTCRAARRLRRR